MIPGLGRSPGEGKGYPFQYSGLENSSDCHSVTVTPVKVTQSCLQPHGLYNPWNSTGQNTEVGKPFPSPGDLPNPGIKPRSPALQVDSSLAEPPGEPKNTGVGSLSLLQGIFPTQESNWGLLQHRQILYQLSYPPLQCRGR